MPPEKSRNLLRKETWFGTAALPLFQRTRPCPGGLGHAQFYSGAACGPTLWKPSLAPRNLHTDPNLNHFCGTVQRVRVFHSIIFDSPHKRKFLEKENGKSKKFCSTSKRPKALCFSPNGRDTLPMKPHGSPLTIFSTAMRPHGWLIARSEACKWMCCLTCLLGQWQAERHMPRRPSKCHGGASSTSQSHPRATSFQKKTCSLSLPILDL